MTHKPPLPDMKGSGLVAYRLDYAGPATYPLAIEGSSYGLVLDDDGETGFLYITSADFEEVFDALHIYNTGGPEAPVSGEELHFVYNIEQLKAGLYYRGMYWAVINFGKSEARCRCGLPAVRPGSWCTSGHSWDEKSVSGLSFNKVEKDSSGPQTGLDV